MLDEFAARIVLDNRVPRMQTSARPHRPWRASHRTAGSDTGSGMPTVRHGGEPGTVMVCSLFSGRCYDFAPRFPASPLPRPVLRARNPHPSAALTEDRVNRSEQ